MRLRKTAGKILAPAIAAVAVGFLIPGQQARAVALTDLPDLSSLTPFATFGNFYNDSLVTVHGNAGISANGELLLAAPSTIDGNLFLGVGATVSGPGIVTGTTFINQNLTTAQSTVYSASTTLKNLAADVTLGDVTSGQSFSGNGAVKVIDMNSLTLGSGNITLTGGANDFFVLNIAHGLSLTGSASIVGSGVDASHILVNLYDSSGANLGVIAHVGDVINGSLLIPYDAATLHSENGAIWSGNKEITLMSGAQVTSVPFSPPTVPDAGSTMLLMSIGLGCLAAVKRKFIS